MQYEFPKVIKNIKDKGLVITEDEHKRIAKDLPDGLGPILSIIKLYAR